MLVRAGRCRRRAPGFGLWALGAAQEQSAQRSAERDRRTGTRNQNPEPGTRNPEPRYRLSLRHEVPLLRADVNLPRPRDLLLGIAQHLFPLREPAGRARNREEHREEVLRKAHRLIDEARVEVDVRIELARHEVFVLQRDALELERDVEQRVPARHLEHLVGDPLDDLRARVVGLVDAVAEAHQPAVARLDARDEGRHVLDRADLLEHPQHRFVGAAVQRPPERRRRAGDGGIRIDLRAADRRASPSCCSSARGRRAG